MEEQLDETSRLNGVLQSLRSTRALPQSPRAQALTDILIALAEELAAVQEQMPTHTVPPVDIQIEALYERLSALERKLNVIQRKVDELATAPRSLPKPTKPVAPARTGEGMLSVEGFLDYWFKPHPDSAPPLPRKEQRRRLARRKDGDGDPLPETTTYTPSSREKLLLTLVPIAAIVVLIILFAIAASSMLSP